MDKHQLSQLLTMQQQCDGKPEKNLPQKSASVVLNLLIHYCILLAPNDVFQRVTLVSWGERVTYSYASKNS